MANCFPNRLKISKYYLEQIVSVSTTFTILSPRRSSKMKMAAEKLVVSLRQVSDLASFVDTLQESATVATSILHVSDFDLPNKGGLVIWQLLQFPIISISISNDLHVTFEAELWPWNNILTKRNKLWTSQGHDYTIMEIFTLTGKKKARNWPWFDLQRVKPAVK